MPSATAAEAPRPALAAYTDVTQLYSGRNSSVFSATCIRTGRSVVLKQYDRSKLRPRQQEYIVSEIQCLESLAACRFTGAVKLLDHFEVTEPQQGRRLTYLVFEPCPRGDLYQLLQRCKPGLSETYVATRVAGPLCAILAQLHARGILHRDVKPENVFLTAAGDVCLGDFGLALHAPSAHPACLMDRVGTLDYMAPEVLVLPDLPRAGPLPLSTPLPGAPCGSLSGAAAPNGVQMTSSVTVVTAAADAVATVSPITLAAASAPGHGAAAAAAAAAVTGNSLSVPSAPLQQQPQPQLPGSTTPLKPPPPTAAAAAAPPPAPLAAASASLLRPYDEKVDSWAVGVLVYELLTGHPPFEVDDPHETARLIVAGRIQYIPTHISRSCVDFIRAALTNDPARRPTASQLLAHPWILDCMAAAATKVPHSRLLAVFGPAGTEPEQQQQQQYGPLPPATPEKAPPSPLSGDKAGTPTPQARAQCTDGACPPPANGSSGSSLLMAAGPWPLGEGAAAPPPPAALLLSPPSPRPSDGETSLAAPSPSSSSSSPSSSSDSSSSLMSSSGRQSSTGTSTSSSLAGAAAAYVMSAAQSAASLGCVAPSLAALWAALSWTDSCAAGTVVQLAGRGGTTGPAAAADTRDLQHQPQTMKRTTLVTAA